MKTIGFMAALLTTTLWLAACASSGEKEDRNEATAVADFIAVNELTSANVIRTMDQMSFHALSDLHVLVKTRREEFLLEYFSRCINYSGSRVEPDYRKDSRALYAKADTFRGCRIKALYRLEPGQADELRTIGETVGGD